MIQLNLSSQQWTPIRVRVDKTADYRSGGHNCGDAYHVARVLILFIILSHMK